MTAHDAEKLGVRMFGVSTVGEKSTEDRTRTLRVLDRSSWAWT